MHMFDFDRDMSFASNTIYGNLRRDAAAEWKTYVEHDFVASIADGSLPRDEFNAWMVQDYFYLVHYTRAYALLLYKSSEIRHMASAATIVHGLLNGEMSLHRRVLEKVGIDSATLDSTPETLETLAYSRYILDRGMCGDVLDLTVTLSACLAGYGEIGLRLLHDPATDLEHNPYRDWIETYASDEYIGLVRNGLTGLEELSAKLGGGRRYPVLLQQFREAVRLEAAFWNAGRTALKMQGLQA